jgi:hypothetical protein
MYPSEFREKYPEQAAEIERNATSAARHIFAEVKAKEESNQRALAAADFRSFIFQKERQRLEKEGIEQAPEKITATASEPVVIAKAESVTFEAMVRQRQKDGLSMAQSILEVAGEFPDAHADFLDRQKNLKPIETLKYTGE